MGLDYGKITTIESFYDGSLKSTKREYSIPKIITDRGHAMSEILSAIDLITAKKTHKIEITIEADPKSYKLRLMTKKYIVNI